MLSHGGWVAAWRREVTNCEPNEEDKMGQLRGSTFRFKGTSMRKWVCFSF
jgi:hypothetical protein